jgi:hypothetical protein
MKMAREKTKMRNDEIEDNVTAAKREISAKKERERK